MGAPGKPGARIFAPVKECWGCSAKDGEEHAVWCPKVAGFIRGMIRKGNTAGTSGSRSR